MPVYEYRALDGGGKRSRGIVDAESPLAARQKLRALKIFPITVQEIPSTSESSSKHHRSVLPFLSFGIRVSDITVMTRGLATLLTAGFPLVGALETLVRQSKATKLKRVIARIKDLVVEGNSFAFALSQFPRTFPAIYINMVQAGEASGTLEVTLTRLADMMENHLDLTNRLKSAMTYPIFMALLGCVVVFFLMTIIVPNIAVVFNDMGRVLPTPTRLLIRFSELLRSFWWLLVLSLASGIILFHRVKRTPRGRELLDGLILKTPMFGSLIIRLSTARFARTLGSLFANGVPLLQALDIAQNVVGKVPISKTVKNAIEDVGKGKGLSEALSAGAVFADLFLDMVKVGEQSGKLEEMLEKVSTIYEKEVTSQMNRITTLLEPIMILIMGVIVGGIVLSICLPIFEMNRLVF